MTDTAEMKDSNKTITTGGNAALGATVKGTQIKKNDIIETDITDLTDLGFGVGRVYGRVIFIADTVPGDKVRAKVIKANTSFLIGKVEQILTRSEAYTDGRCDKGCKSCAYRCISYEHEARLKENNIRHLFSTEELSGINVEPIVTSPLELRYRNKAQYPITKAPDGYRVGFYAPKSHRITSIDDCPLTPHLFSQICKELCTYFEQENISVYNEETGEGILRHIYLRRADDDREILVTIVINGETLPRVEKMAYELMSRFPTIVGVLLNINKKNTNVVLGDEFRTVRGRDHIFDTLAGVRLKITAPSFYQVNHDCAELLYAMAKKLAAPTKLDTLLDLYCGAGSIGLSMTADAKELIGVEIVESAIECAKENARANGITNAHFFVGDAAHTEHLLKSAETELEHPICSDIIILDPPRGGCAEELINFVSSLSARRIVYISCNPKTLARDIVKFRALGYDTNSVTPVDMFPMTGHCESIVLMTKVKS